MDYAEKYKYVITRLLYAMYPYFKDIKDIDENEIIDTATDNLAIYYDSIGLKTTPKRLKPFEIIEQNDEIFIR